MTLPFHVDPADERGGVDLPRGAVIRFAKRGDMKDVRYGTVGAVYWFDGPVVSLTTADGHESLFLTTADGGDVILARVA